jgi:hypothetical protein
MSSAVGCPLDDAAGLVAAAGVLVRSCANDEMTARVEQKRIVKDREVFMLLILLTALSDSQEVLRSRCRGRLGVLDR